MKVTYEEWSATAKSIDTHEFSRDGIRDVYDTPFGIQIEEESVLPRSPFKPAHHQTVVNVILPMDKEEWLKATYGGWLNDQRYTEDGFGMPVFNDTDDSDGSRRAWKFLEAEHKNLKLLNGEPRR
jgi:hypothetical protein